MGLYDGIKDVANVIRKADNVELYQQLIDLSAQALEMQNEITRLNNENAELKRIRDVEEKIERHEDLYITLKGDIVKIFYCSHCWDFERKLIQVACFDNGYYQCPHCKYQEIYDRDKKSSYHSGSLGSTFLSGSRNDGDK